MYCEKRVRCIEGKGAAVSGGNEMIVADEVGGGVGRGWVAA